MQITYLESVDSTQSYLKSLLKSGEVEAPHAVVTQIQTNGIGSRGNSWQGIDGNIFLSFAVELAKIPSDLKLESASIYFAYLLKETLSEMNSSVWLKWPNDFYIGELKIGGMITNIFQEKTLVCGVGLNLVKAPAGFGSLDMKISKDELLEKSYTKVEKSISWKQVFSKYELEFHHSKNFFTHNKSLKILLDDVSLQCDGSIVSNGKRIYSLR